MIAPRSENEQAMLEVVRYARTLLRRLDSGATLHGGLRNNLRNALANLDRLNP